MASLASRNKQIEGTFKALPTFENCTSYAKRYELPLVDWTGIEGMFARHGLAPEVSAMVHRPAVPIYREGRQVGFALDPACTELYEEAKHQHKKEGYCFFKSDKGRVATSDDPGASKVSEPTCVRSSIGTGTSTRSGWCSA